MKSLARVFVHTFSKSESTTNRFFKITDFLLAREDEPEGLELYFVFENLEGGC